MGAFFFVLSLGFKQMTLYYAPAIGSYLLAKCLYLGPFEGYFFLFFSFCMLNYTHLCFRVSGRLFIRLALVTTSTFLLLFLPFLPPFAPFPAILNPISRIFPFDRGLFEDKVANFWCASNVIFKWKAWASRGLLVKVSTLLTALGFLPAVVGLLRAGIQHSQNLNNQAAEVAVKKKHTPFLPLLTYALLSSSMSFFLFSFQVHEKTILLPLLPITLLLSGASVDSTVYLWGALVNNVAVFRLFFFSLSSDTFPLFDFNSMWPLLKRDGLGVQYIATLLLWNRLIGYNPGRLRPRSFIQLLSIVSFIFALTKFFP